MSSSPFSVPGQPLPPLKSHCLSPARSILVPAPAALPTDSLCILAIPNVAKLLGSSLAHPEPWKDLEASLLSWLKLLRASLPLCP